MNRWPVEQAQDADRVWIGALFQAEAQVLGVNFGAIWYRWLHRTTDRERWLVVRPLGFAHYLARLDGVRVLYELAVRPDARRQGIGTALLAAIGRPMVLKTDVGNLAANSFYLALGFHLTGIHPSRDGRRLLNRYRLA